jgi:hypothetical protein
MPGLFGTRALLQTDVNLLLQIIAVVILVVSYLYRRQAKKHGALVGVATGIEIGTVVVFMGPEFINTYLFFFTNFTPLIISFLINIFAGAAALVLAVGLLVLWATHFSNLGLCYKRNRKRIMDLTIILWIVSFAFGVAGYVLAYI